MKKIIISLIIIFISVQAYANPLQFMWQDESDKWSLQDTILEGTFMSLVLIDVMQTRYFLDMPPKYITKDGKDYIQTHEENNIFMGEYPSKTKLYLLSSSGIILHLGISYIIPKPYRNIWQSVWIGMRIKNIYHNYQAVGGFHIKF